MMPGLDGYQVTRILRHDSRTSHIPIILLTALNTKESRIKGWRENIDIYVAKPFDAKELNAQLDNILIIRKILQQQTNKVIKSNGSLNALDLPLQDLKFIEKFKEVIEKNYTNNHFQKADLASKMAVSERQLQRKVNALIDENPLNMLRNYRLEKAAINLKNGYQVSIVSEECGFNSVPYFCRCFRENYGVSPKKYQILHKHNK
jgi:AraC-like DNA-binding protein